MPSASSHFNVLSSFALTLLIASLGGALFVIARLPLPFMLGGMAACLAASLFKLPVSIPKLMRQPMSSIIGVMLGSGFTPQILASVPDWIGPLAGLAGFLVVAALGSVTFYRKVARYDTKTAYFAGMPGGLLEMTMLGEAYGADAKRIALAHSARILIVVFTLPFLVQMLSGQDISREAISSEAPLTLEALVWLAITGIVGTAVGRVLKLPAWALLGPMALSAFIHATGTSDFKPPSEVVGLAQIVLGASIGCRFAGITAKELARTLVLALGATLVLLTITLMAAYGVALLVPVAPVDLLLAYSPGGLAEMGLIALALNVDVAFVSGHHIVRVVMVSTGAGLLAPRLHSPNAAD